MKFEIRNRWNGNIQYKCDLDVALDTAAPSLRLGAAIKIAYNSGADLSDADLRGADLSGAVLSGAKISAIKVFTGLYCYQVWAVLFQNGSRWVRMGCLFKSLEDWEKIGIRKSNVAEFPDDGSPQCEERVRAFEFAKNAALEMKLLAE